MTETERHNTERLACPITDVGFLMPHSGEMVLLDRVTAFDDTSLHAEVEVRAGNILLADGVLPLLVGMEIMAQGIAALSGCRSLLAGEPIRLGFLLGTRKLILFTDAVPVGTRLAVSVAESVHDDNGFGVFDCSLRWLSAPEGWAARLPEDGVLVQAALNVYSPPDGQHLKLA